MELDTLTEENNYYNNHLQNLREKYLQKVINMNYVFVDYKLLRLKKIKNVIR